MANVDSERNPLEILAEEFADRHRRGEYPSLSEYARRHPNLAEEIEQLFPTIVAMEQLKHRKLESGSGRASLGQTRLEWLGDFRIIREIGRGGMGIVYEAEQQSLGRRVAIKVLPRQATLESKQLLRFQREAQTAARLHHTNIVPVYGVGHQDGFHYYAMQYIRGLGLDVVLAELKRQEWSTDDAEGCRLVAPSDGAGVSAAAAALAMLDGRFSVPRKPGGSSELNVIAAEPDGSATGDPVAPLPVPVPEVRNRRLSPADTEDRRPGGRAVPAPGDGAARDGAARDAAAPAGDAANVAAAAGAVARGVVADDAAVIDAVSGDSAEPASAAAVSADDDAWAVPDLNQSGEQRSVHAETQTESPDDTTRMKPARQRVRLRGHRYWRSVARIGMQVADALQYAHTQGTLHRDIKPGNLLLGSDGSVWVTDFGLARALDNDRVTQTGDIIGTLRYMAPEQFEREADVRSDIYSLGLTLYELLTLQPAFEGTNRNQLIQRVTQGNPVRLRSLCPEIPRDLETIVLKAIAREPSHRYQTAGQLCEDLHRFLEDRTVLARRPNAAERMWRWCRRNRAVAALTFFAFSAMLLAAIVGWVGYVRTARQHAQARAATARAEDNLELALRAFEDVFNNVSGQEAFRPLESNEEESWQEPPPEHAIGPEDVALLQRMLVFYDQFAARNSGNVNLSLETARASRRVGDIHRRLGNLEAAEAAYRKALDTYATLAESIGHPREYAVERAGIKSELAQTLSRRRKASEAAQELLSAERLLAGLPTELAARPATQMELVRIYNLMATLRVRPDILSREKLAANSEKSIEILNNLLSNDRENPEYRLAMAQCKLNQSRSTPFGSDAEASRQADEAIQMLQDLVEDFPNNPNYQFALAETYSRTSISRSMWRKPKVARERMEASLALLTELADQYEHLPEYRSSLARAHTRLGVHLMMMSDHKLALRELETSLAMQLDLAEQYPAVPAYRLTLGWSEYMLARYHLRQNRFEDACLLLDQVVDTTSGLLEVGHEPQLTLVLQSEAYESLAEIMLRQGNSAQAEVLADLALQDRGKLAILRGESSDERGRLPQGMPRFGFPSFESSRGGSPEGGRRAPASGRPRRERRPSAEPQLPAEPAAGRNNSDPPTRRERLPARITTTLIASPRTLG